jgi:thymidylate synthase ThyX
MESENTHKTLRHHVRTLRGGGLVLLLDTGASIGPEAEAMLQALYSRSPATVHEHLRTIAEKGAEKFMASFYVGYGHKSIGDCGTVTLFIEGISMLAAKAIQDWMLYSGQEVSTRYVDFSTQRFEDPIATPASARLLARLRSFYVTALPILEADLKKRYPMGEGEKETMYTKAIKARAFDILRSFLPAGATTSVAWHTNLRQAADKIALLRHHPLKEVRDVADDIEAVLLDGYPSSFGHKRYDATEAFNASWMNGSYYLEDDACPSFELTHDSVAYAEFASRPELAHILSGRPPKTELPKYLGELGTMQFRFLLDFGSFRDIQRQRAVHQRMPLLTYVHGFEPWYLEQLPDVLRVEAETLLAENQDAVQELGVSKEDMQYFIPMGYLAPNRLTGDIPALVYLAELRAGSTVHPTLQVRARQIASALEGRLSKYGLKLYIEGESGRFDVKRGAQDITRKE